MHAMKQWFVLVMVTQLIWSCPASKNISQEKKEKIESFLKTVVVESLERDYRSHNMSIHPIIANITIDKVNQGETGQDTVYLIRGRVTYIIKGKRAWKDASGNVIQLAPEQEITHWFTCGILEDKYLGRFFEDDRNKLAFFADKPE